VADKNDKQKIPAYLGFNAFTGFINGLRESGLPLKIDKSVLPKASGSQFSATMAALRFLRLVDDSDKPTPKMQELVASPDDGRKAIYQGILKDAYAFLFTDPEFHLDKATGNQVADKFRAENVSGTTVSKSMAFFLALAQAADVKISHHVKPPTVARSAKRSNKPGKKDDTAAHDADDDDEGEDDGGDVERFEIPIPGKRSVRVIVPSDLDADDWTMLQSMITVYINRWKGFQAEPKKTEADDA
jgi:Family of unknown function (DUF5343)